MFSTKAVITTAGLALINAASASNKITITHIDDGTGWRITTERSLEKDFGSGKLLYNRFSGKLFYAESPTEYYRLNGAPW